MALPPIISNLPIIKLFKADAAQAPAPGKTDSVKPSGATPQDVVEISEAARQRLAGVQDMSAGDANKAQAIAAETRNLLAETDLALGLDPQFTE